MVLTKEKAKENIADIINCKSKINRKLYPVRINNFYNSVL